MMHAKITGERIRHHLAYSWWKYALLLVVTLVAWDWLYIEKIPPELKVDVYVVAPTGNTEQLSADLQPELAAAFPDQREINFLQINLDRTNERSDPNVLMQFTTYVAAQQGDLFLLPAERFAALATDEDGCWFLPLDAYVESGAISLDGLDASAYVLTAADGDGQPRRYGLPADAQYQLLTQYGINPQGMVWGIPVYTKNPDNAAKLMDWLAQRLTSEKPEGYDEYQRLLLEQQQEQQQQQQQGLTQLLP